MARQFEDKNKKSSNFSGKTAGPKREGRPTRGQEQERKTDFRKSVPAQRNPVDYPGGISAGKKICPNFGKCGG